jgi:flagellar motor protein MotB
VPASPWAEIATPVQGVPSLWEAPRPSSASKPAGLWATNPPTFGGSERQAIPSAPPPGTENVPRAELQALKAGKRRAWLVTLLVLAGAGVGGYYASNERQRLTSAVAQSESSRRAAEAAHKETLARLEKQGSDLSALEKKTKPLVEKAAAAGATRDATARLGADLKKQLADDKDITVEAGDDRVVVSMAQKALFANDEGVPGPDGVRVLARVSKALKAAGKVATTHQALVTAHAAERKVPRPARLPKFLNAPFATAWELSGARAAAVARFLVDDAGLPSKLVSATTTAPRPAPARNAKPTPDRIEIVLQPASRP